MSGIQPSDFKSACRFLEEKMKLLFEQTVKPVLQEEWSIVRDKNDNHMVEDYLPNIYPSQKAKYLFISSMPSYNRGRNVINNLQYERNLLFHSAIQFWLSQEDPDATYHITDVSKLQTVTLRTSPVSGFVCGCIASNFQGIGKIICDSIIDEINTVGRDDCITVFLQPVAKTMLAYNDRTHRFQDCPTLYHYSSKFSHNTLRTLLGDSFQNRIPVKDARLCSFKTLCDYYKEWLGENTIPLKPPQISLDPKIVRIGFSYYSAMMNKISHREHCGKINEFTHLFGRFQ
jgi:hypothetical protein